MRTSEQINELAAALALAQSEMKNAKLNRQNPHFKSRYSDLAEIRDTVTPALSKNGIAVVQGTDMTEMGILVVTRLIHKSGQWIESRFPIAQDKPQAMGSSYTYAKRYSLSAICNISADEDDDAEVAQSRPSYQGTQKPVAQPAVESIADTFIRRFNEATTAEAFEEEVDKARAAWGRFDKDGKAKVANSIETRRAHWLRQSFPDAMQEAAE